MKVQTRRKVSYVIRQPNGKKAHCLGVNSLAIDTSAVYNSTVETGAAEGCLLYSAGRDGVVAGWQVHIPLQQQQPLLNGSPQWIHDREVLVRQTEEKQPLMLLTPLGSIGFFTGHLPGLLTDAHGLGQ